MEFKIGQRVVCSNIIDYRTQSKTQMKYIYLGDEYLVTNVHISSIVVRHIKSGTSPGCYSNIFFSRKCTLNKNIRVL